MSVGKGAGVDSPPPHPLAYFLTDPCVRPQSDQLALGLCFPTSTPGELERRAKTTPELTEVGTIDGLKVYDLWYSTHINGQSSRDLRSVLVKTGPDEYREIDVQVCLRPASFPTTAILELGREALLMVQWRDGGNNAGIYKIPYVLRANGIEKADLGAVSAAIKELTPAHMSTRSWVEDFAAMKTTVELYRDDTNEPPVAVRERGRITVTYRFVNGRAVVTGKTYQAYLQN